MRLLSRPCRSRPSRPRSPSRRRRPARLIARLDARRAPPLGALHRCRRSSRRPAARVVAPSLGLYLVPNVPRASVWFPLSASAARSGSARRTGSQARSRVTDFTDPLVPTEWWRSVIGVDALDSPRARARRSRSSTRVSTSRTRSSSGARTRRRSTTRSRPASAASTARRSASVVGRAGQRARRRRRLSRGGAPLVGCREGAGHAARDVPDRAGHPRRGEQRPRRRQPQPRRRQQGGR